MRFGAPSSFFFNDTQHTDIYPLSLHDALPIWSFIQRFGAEPLKSGGAGIAVDGATQDVYVAEFKTNRVDVFEPEPDRKSTRLNSSHRTSSYAVFCLKKKTEAIRREVEQKQKQK